MRPDHVLGYYRSYLFSENARGRLTLESLGLYRALRELQERGRAAGDDVKRAAEDEARRLLLEKFKYLGSDGKHAPLSIAERMEE